MALSLESSNRVWQRVAIALRGANEASAQQFKELKKYLATQKGNPQLQFVAINGAVNSSDSGNTASQVLANAPCTLYALYLKKASGATAVWFKGKNHASTATTDGTQEIAEQSAIANEEIVRAYLTGKALSAGLTVTEDTTATGSTLTLLANRFDGFVIIGQ
jgi:hypothetical protein